MPALLEAGRVMALEAIEKPKAKERVGGRPSKTAGKLPAVDPGRVRDKVAPAVGMSKRHANRLVDAAEVAGLVGPIGPTPSNEAQVRALAPLKGDPEQVREAWARRRAEIRVGQVLGPPEQGKRTDLSHACDKSDSIPKDDRVRFRKLAGVLS